MASLRWACGGLELRFSWGDDRPVSLTRWSDGNVRVRFPRPVPLVEILADGHGHLLASNRLANTMIGMRMRYGSHDEPAPDILRIVQRDPETGLEATTMLRAVGGTRVVRAHTTVTNRGDHAHTLRSVSTWTQSFGVPAALEGMDGDYPSWTLTEGVNDWMKENRWTTRPVARICPVESGHVSRNGYAVVSRGSFSTGSHSPFLILDSPRLALTWACQIEHDGPWRWELGNDGRDGDLTLSGPEDMDHDWHTTLTPGDSFTSVPAAVTLAGSPDGVMDRMTSYRRAITGPHGGTGPVDVVFNDYMNTLDGDPTTERLLPLIDAAAAAGAETFCIDAGWYADQGDWWTQVGVWEPSRRRFPNGLREVTDRIRSQGMKVGLWLEPEVVGVDSPLAKTLPDSAFMSVRGTRVTEQGRHLLDLTDPAARAHLDAVVDRLVAGYNVSYLKLDYNVDTGPGTDTDGRSRGMGLLEHARAHRTWLAGLRDRHPKLTIENCASGAMRADQSLLEIANLQSTSDQIDPERYPPIASGAGMTILPEQAANWAYPQPDMDERNILFTMATGMAGRLYLSGHLDRMDARQRDLVRRSVDSYKTRIRPHLTGLVPYWPTGLPRWDDQVVSYGLRPPQGREGRTILYLWNRRNTLPVTLRAPHLTGRNAAIDTVLPSTASWNPVWNRDAGTLSVQPTGKGPEVVILILTAI